MTIEHVKAALYTYLAKIAYSKLQRRHKKYFGKKIKVILIAGNVGKSSLTMIVTQILRSARYHVLTGTSLTKNLNTPAGILKTLVPGASTLIDIVWQLIQGRLVETQPGTVLVQELGIDQTGGAERFVSIFGSVDIAAAAILAEEHGAEFVPEFGVLGKWASKLPPLLVQKYTSIGNPLLSNILFEQLRLLSLGSFIFCPNKLNSTPSQLITYSKKKEHSAGFVTKYNDSALVVNGMQTNPDYLLPESFGITISIAQKIAEHLQIDPNIVKKSLLIMEVPNGRFSQFVGKKPFSRIVDSTYNSDPLSMHSFLQLIEKNSRQASHHVLVIGEMRELGEASTEAHTKLVRQLQKIKESNQCSIILLGSEWNQIDKAAIDTLGAIIANSVGQIYKKIIPSLTLPDHTWLWCKGSQNTIFLEECVKYYLQDPKYSQFLCRQEPEWLEKKAAYL